MMDIDKILDRDSIWSVRESHQVFLERIYKPKSRVYSTAHNDERLVRSFISQFVTSAAKINSSIYSVEPLGNIRTEHSEERSVVGAIWANGAIFKITNKEYGDRLLLCIDEGDAKRCKLPEKNYTYIDEKQVVKFIGEYDGEEGKQEDTTQD
jgi:hypothetical protein